MLEDRPYREPDRPSISRLCEIRCSSIGILSKNRHVPDRSEVIMNRQKCITKAAGLKDTRCAWQINEMAIIIQGVSEDGRSKNARRQWLKENRIARKETETKC